MADKTYRGGPDHKAEGPTSPETDGDLLQRLGTDAQAWARELLQHCQILDQEDAEYFLTTWFANAIELAGNVAFAKATSDYLSGELRGDGRHYHALFIAKDEIDGAAGRTVPMILHCPQCGARHIDEGEFASRAHHTHACQSCGSLWRPAKLNTHGVQFLPGFKNAPITQ